MTRFELVLEVLPFKLHTFPKFTKLWHLKKEIVRMWESNPHETICEIEGIIGFLSDEIHPF